MTSLRDALDWSRWEYLLRGLVSLWQPRACPCCGESDGEVVDRKLAYSLRACSGCGILFRHPREPAGAMHEFYQEEYAQPGLTTELPTKEQLRGLLRDGFAGTSKDFSRVAVLLAALGLSPGAAVLDFGASWGYGTYQLRRAGYAAEAFEVSGPRAAFGTELGVEIHTSLDALPGPFDAVYSSHVLEHVPNPLATLRELLARTRPGGFVLAHTPNGSEARRRRDFEGFHRHWGRVHPVLLCDRFIERSFPGLAVYVSSRSDPDALRSWDRLERVFDSLDGSELFFVLRRPAEGAAASREPA